MEKLDNLSLEEITIISGGGVFGTDKSFTEWIYYGVGATIGAIVQINKNAAELRYEANENTLYGHYGGARI